MNTRVERIKVVNEIIKAIASTGRHFFRNNHDGDIAFIFEKNKRLYMKNEYIKSEMCLSTKYGYPPRTFHHGGTLWGLTKDFKEFIIKGGDTNHNNGYGGLYCTHWGYSEDNMIKIREVAIKLGYLKQ